MGPLDEALSTPAKPRRNKRVMIAAGVVVAALIPIVQSTFAAQITVSADPIEFGQGVASVTACEPAVTITPFSYFDSGSTAFKVSQFTLNATNPSSVIGNDCAGKTFTVTLRSDFTALKIYTFTISRSGDVGSYTYAITNPSVDVGSDPTIATDGRLVTINTNLDVDSTSVTRITIESS